MIKNQIKNRLNDKFSMKGSLRVFIISLLLLTGAILIFDSGSFQGEGADNVDESVCANTRATRSDDAVAIWHFDEGSGQVAFDSSSNGNDGQLGTTIDVDDSDPTWVDGVNGKAIRCDGKDDIVSIKDNEIFKPESLSLSSWVNVQKAVESAHIVTKQGSYAIKIGSITETGFNINFNIIYSNRDFNLAATDLEHFKWYHVVGTVSSLGRAKIYINGESRNAESTYLHTIEYNEKPFTIGGPKPFNGIIDEVGFWNRTLNDEEVYQLYNESKPEIDEVPGPGDPTKINVVATPGDGNVILSWDAISGADSYNIYRSTTSGSGFTKLNTDIITGITYTDFTVTNDVTYYYHLKIVIDSEESLPSIEVSATPSVISVHSDAVAIWHLDEGSGDSVSDSSGNDKDGTIHGATWTTGTAGNALSFDGVDDYVTVQPPPLDTGVMSLSIWLYFNEAPSIMDDYKYVSISQDDANTIIFQLTTHYGRICWHRIGENDVSPTDSIEIDRWYHVVVTFDGVTHDLYLDGKRSSTDVGTLSPSNTIPINIGRKNTGEDWSYFDGKIDEIAIYDRVLSDQEILELYQNPGQVIIPPKNVIASLGDNTIILTWDTATNVDGYNIYRSTTLNSGLTKLNTDVVTGNTYTDKSVENNITYYYHVKSVKNDEESSPSSEVHATAIVEDTDDDKKKDEDKGFLPGFETSFLLIGFLAVLLYLHRRKRI